MNLSIGEISWRQPSVFVVATVVTTVLAIWAVVSASVAPVPGVSGLYIVAAIYVPLALFGEIPWAIFPTVFFGWVFGDIIVLSTIGTVVAIILTSYIVRSRIHVRGFIT
jgi:hypothetical protein